MLRIEGYGHQGTAVRVNQFSGRGQTRRAAARNQILLLARAAQRNRRDSRRRRTIPAAPSSLPHRASSVDTADTSAHIEGSPHSESVVPETVPAAANAFAPPYQSTPSPFCHTTDREDLAFAIYALTHGVNADEVSGTLRARDLSHKGDEKRQQQYVERTVAKALAVTEGRTRG